MPAEWEPHAATWLAWPHERTDWPGKFAPIPWVYADIVRHLARVERVRILVQNREAQSHARRVLEKSGADLGGVEFFIVPTNRGWIRDFGPIFLKKTANRDAEESGNRGGDIALTNWRFNAWAKYDDWKNDDDATRRLIPKLKLPFWEPVYKARETPAERRPRQKAWKLETRVVLEGGSIDVNGRGTLITTEECLLSSTQSRNPALTREDLQAVFRDYLGITSVLWLGCGIAGDDTHGHVDDLARFVDPSTIVTVVEANPGDANFEPLQENLARLREMKDQSGQPIRIETLPMPQPVYFAGQRLPASYANFYIANNLVLVPTFSDAHDRIALSTLARLFPGREVIGIGCRDLVLGLGTLHCMTQQQPT